MSRGRITMRTSVIKLGISAMLLLFTVGTVMAAVYTYKCPKCGLIQQYDRAGFYKCPKDGWIMTRVY